MKYKQITNQVLMIEPVNFGFNPETASNNYFQHQDNNNEGKIQVLALQEFRQMVEGLHQKGVKVEVIQDTPAPCTPDSIFPNNWVSFHEEGYTIIYPMFAPNRRLERRCDLLARFGKERLLVDYTTWEDQGAFLEGTGSMVLDRGNRIAYACLSPRTDAALFQRFCEEQRYTPIAFEAFHLVEGQYSPIYHTNVMMALGSKFAVICLESIHNEKQRRAVELSLKETGHEIVPISLEQVNHFVGNMLEVQGDEDKALLCLSTSALSALTFTQKQILNQYVELLPFSIPTIERIGGGGVRCMMAEVF